MACVAEVEIEATATGQAPTPVTAPEMEATTTGRALTPVTAPEMEAMATGRAPTPVTAPGPERHVSNPIQPGATDTMEVFLVRIRTQLHYLTIIK